MNPRYILILLLSSLALASSDMPSITSTTTTSAKTSSTSSKSSSTKSLSSSSKASGIGGVAKTSKMPSLATSSSSTAITFTAVVPDTKNDPYILRSHHPNGTVFIAVGSIILSLFAMLFFYKFWNFLNSRRNASRFDDKFDDYYGGVKPFNESPDVTNNSTYFFDSTLKHNKDNSMSTIQSGSTYGGASGLIGAGVAAAKHTASNSRSSSHNSSNSSSSDDRGSIYFGLNEDLDKLAPQQGRSLRTALNIAANESTQSLELLTMPKKTARNSFISPINEMIEMTNRQQQYGSGVGHNHSISSSVGGHNRSTSSLAGGYLPSIVVEPPNAREDSRSPSPSSVNFNLAGDSFSKSHNAKSSSMSMIDLSRMVENSMRSPSPEVEDNSDESKNKLKVQKPQARPPSMVLDSLMRGDDI